MTKSRTRAKKESLEPITPDYRPPVFHETPSGLLTLGAIVPPGAGVSNRKYSSAYRTLAAGLVFLMSGMPGLVGYIIKGSNNDTQTEEKIAHSPIRQPRPQFGVLEIISGVTNRNVLEDLTIRNKHRREDYPRYYLGDDELVREVYLNSTNSKPKELYFIDSR
ncbi:hypothetical protein HYU23_04435 [Candidatus Woesearchaeota archaeon]|nr:hypothetical protein [Candidatus Woesearchaeota archaeon]